MIFHGGKVLAISEGIALEISLEVFLQTISCAEEMYYPKDVFTFKFAWQSRYFWTSLAENGHWPPLEGDEKKASTSTGGQVQCYVSEYSEFLILDAGPARSVIFGGRVLKGSELSTFAQSLGNLGALIDDGIHIDAEISLPWEMLNDETFEQLCYDIIYQNSKFDRTTIRKMGKSRSRDGGRDIVVETKVKPGEKSKKYIYQCKFYKATSSANTSNVSSISDVIDQYGAQGYGLMCSCYIDSTLYDKLDGISSHRNIEKDTWSIFEMERYIARRPHLKERFFQNK